MTALERAAKASRDHSMARLHANLERFPWEALDRESRRALISDMRAAFAAVREPGEKVLIPVRIGLGARNVDEVFRLVIDAILEETP